MIYKFILFSPRLLKNPVKEHRKGHQGMNLQLVVDLISEPTVNQKQKQQTPTCVCVYACIYTHIQICSCTNLYLSIEIDLILCMSVCVPVHNVCMYVCMHT